MDICSDSRMKGRKLTYPRRLFLWLLCYSLLLVGCFVVFQYHREKEFKAAEINSQLQLINTYILSELKEGRNVADMDLHEFHPYKDLRVSIISDKGDVLYDNALDSIRRTNHLDREEIQQALKGNAGYAVRRHSASTGGFYFYSASRGDDGLIVRTAVPYTVSLSTLLKADFGFLWVMGMVTTVMCVLGYFATRRLGQNILRLNSFAENMEKGVRISDTEPFPHDELGDISNNIVRLYARLQEATTERDAEHRAALHEQREKERLKKELTNNINHELKTPVASIQACVETLVSHKDMTEVTRDKFMQRCLANTRRLSRLLSDVSLITRMDDGGEAIARERVNLTDIVCEAMEDHTAAAALQGIRLVNELELPLEMTGNASLLASIFNNLIENAIAYSGGSRFVIAPSTVTDEEIRLTVSDNGTGIAEEHLDRIFGRFYRIDKGRSRKAGSTGLGLSIVKNAVLFHGGSIKVRNARGGGLEFAVTFRRKGKES